MEQRWNDLPHTNIHIYSGKCSRNLTFYEQHSVSFLLHVMTLPYTGYTHQYTYTPIVALILHHRNVLYDFCQLSTTFTDWCMVCVSFFCFFFLSFCHVVRIHSACNTDNIWNWRHKIEEDKKKLGNLQNYDYIHCFNLWTCNVYWHSFGVHFCEAIEHWIFNVIPIPRKYNLKHDKISKSKCKPDALYHQTKMKNHSDFHIFQRWIKSQR